MRARILPCPMTDHALLGGTVRATALRRNVVKYCGLDVPHSFTNAANLCWAEASLGIAYFYHGPAHRRLCKFVAQVKEAICCGPGVDVLPACDRRHSTLAALETLRINASVELPTQGTSATDYDGICDRLDRGLPSILLSSEHAWIVTGYMKTLSGRRFLALRDPADYPTEDTAEFKSLDFFGYDRYLLTRPSSLPVRPISRYPLSWTPEELVDSALATRSFRPFVGGELLLGAPEGSERPADAAFERGVEDFLADLGLGVHADGRERLVLLSLALPVHQAKLADLETADLGGSSAPLSWRLLVSTERGAVGVAEVAQGSEGWRVTRFLRGRAFSSLVPALSWLLSARVEVAPGQVGRDAHWLEFLEAGIRAIWFTGSDGRRWVIPLGPRLYGLREGQPLESDRYLEVLRQIRAAGQEEG